MRRKAKPLPIHRRKSASKETSPSPQCWVLIFLVIAGINMAVFSFSVDHANQRYQPKVSLWTSSILSGFHKTAKLPPESDATTAEKGVIWKYRLPDGVEFSLMQMPTLHAVAAGTRYIAAHR
jgi:hypothetical protein